MRKLMKKRKTKSKLVKTKNKNNIKKHFFKKKTLKHEKTKDKIKK